MPKSRRPRTKINFTKRAIEALPTPTVESRVFDQQVPGLGVLLYPSGTRSFFYLKSVRGYPKRTTIGKFPAVTIEQARGKASALNAALSKWKLNDFSGTDPFEGKKRDPSLDALAAMYVEKQVKKHASHPDRATKAVEWQIKKYLSPWRNRRIDSIRKSDVRDLHERIGDEHGKYAANRVLQLLRALFYWGEESGVWVGSNPCLGVKLFREEERTRFVQPDEMPRLFAALRQESNVDLRDFVNLALWTGARRGDIFSMRWSDLALEDNRWTVPHPKNGKPYPIALTPEAIEILKARKNRARNESPWVFPSRGKTGHVVDLKTAWFKLLTRARLSDLRIHDLRRTLGSYQAAQGASLKIIGKSLGHKSLAATAIYSQLNLEPVRASVLSATRAMIAASRIEETKQIEG